MCNRSFGCIGHSLSNKKINLHNFNDQVELQNIKGKNYFVSCLWNKNIKQIYTLNGSHIGNIRLHFDKYKHLKKYYEIKDNLILFKNNIIGKIIIHFDTKQYDNVDTDVHYQNILNQREIIHQ